MARIIKKHLTDPSKDTVVLEQKNKDLDIYMIADMQNQKNEDMEYYYTVEE